MTRFYPHVAPMLASQSLRTLAALMVGSALLASGIVLAAPAKKSAQKSKGCGKNLSCLIKASEKCAPATVAMTSTVDLFGVVQTTSGPLEIRGFKDGQCVLYRKLLKNSVKFSKQFTKDAKADGATDADLKAQFKEANALAKSLEGLDGTCRFAPKDLTALLKRWKAGKFSTDDYDRATCEGGLFEHGAAGAAAPKDAPTSGSSFLEPLASSSAEAMRTGCPFTVEVVQQKCGIPSTLSLHIKEEQGFGTAGNRRCVVDIEEPQTGSKGGDRREFTRPLLSYEADPYPPASVNVFPGEEEIFGIGEKAKLSKNFANPTEQQCGRNDFGSKLETVSRGTKFWLNSGGAELELWQWPPVSSSCPTQRTPAGGGCSVDELKAIANEVVIPHLVTVDPLLGVFQLKDGYTVGEEIEGTFTLTNEQAAFAGQVTQELCSRAGECQKTTTDEQIGRQKVFAISTAAKKEGMLWIRYTIYRTGESKPVDSFVAGMIIWPKPVRAALPARTREDKTWKDGCPPVELVAPLCAGPQKLLTRKTEVNKGVKDGYPYDDAVCSYEGYLGTDLATLLMISISRFDATPLSTQEIDDAVADPNPQYIVGRNEVGLRSVRVERPEAGPSLTLAPSATRIISVNPSISYDPSRPLDACRSSDLVKVGRLFVR